MALPKVSCPVSWRSSARSNCSGTLKPVAAMLCADCSSVPWKSRRVRPRSARFFSLKAPVSAALLTDCLIASSSSPCTSTRCGESKPEPRGVTTFPMITPGGGAPSSAGPPRCVASHASMTFLSVRLGMSASDARRSLVSGDVRLMCSHSVIMSRSYVWPSAAMTGSSMTSRLMGQRKSEASISLGSLCGPGWWLVCARAPSASRRSSRPSSLSARRGAAGRHRRPAVRARVARARVADEAEVFADEHALAELGVRARRRELVAREPRVPLGRRDAFPRDFGRARVARADAHDGRDAPLALEGAALHALVLVERVDRRPNREPRRLGGRGRGHVGRPREAAVTPYADVGGGRRLGRLLEVGALDGLLALAREEPALARGARRGLAHAAGAGDGLGGVARFNGVFHGVDAAQMR